MKPWFWMFLGIGTDFDFIIYRQFKNVLSNFLKGVGGQYLKFNVIVHFLCFWA